MTGTGTFNLRNIDKITEDSLEDNKARIQKKAKEVQNDREEIKKVLEATQKDRMRLEMTFNKAGINLPNTRNKEGDQSDINAKNDNVQTPNISGARGNVGKVGIIGQAERNKMVKEVKGVPKNVQKALEYYDIIYK